MRILFLSDNCWPETNAPATRLQEHSRRWSAAGHQVSIITGAPNFPEGRVFDGYSNRWYYVEHEDGVRIVRVKTYIAANAGFLKRTLDFASFMVSGVIAGLVEEEPDLIVATSPQLFSALGGWLLARLRHRPFVFELRDLWPATIVAVHAVKYRGLVAALEKLELFLYRQADSIIALTPAFRENLIARGIDGAKIAVVPNGVDLEQYAPTLRKDPDLTTRLGLEGQFVVGYLGTHGICQGLESVVEAAIALRERDDIAFLMVGAGAERQKILDMVASESLTNVHMLPLQPKERMPAIWSLCDAALIPLRDRAVFRTVVPSKLFEAMGMGVPILLAVPEGEATRILHENGVGLVVPPEDPAALTAAILRLHSDEDLRTELRGACLERAPTFSRDRLALEMIQAFQTAIAQSSLL